MCMYRPGKNNKWGRIDSRGVRNIEELVRAAKEGSTTGVHNTIHSGYKDQFHLFVGQIYQGDVLAFREKPNEPAERASALKMDPELRPLVESSSPRKSQTIEDLFPEKKRAQAKKSMRRSM